LAFYGDRGPKVFKDGIRSIKNKNLKDTVVRDHISNDSFAVGTIMEVSNNNLTTTEESSEALYPKKSRRSHSAGDVLAEEKTGHKVLEMSSKTDDAVTSVLKHTYLENASAKKKVCISNILQSNLSMFGKLNPILCLSMCKFVIPCLHLLPCSAFNNIASILAV
jgi:hypothetical protein